MWTAIRKPMVPSSHPDIRPTDTLGDAGWLSSDDNEQKKRKCDAECDQAKKDYEDLKRQKTSLDPKTPKADRDTLDKKIQAALDRVLKLNPFEFGNPKPKNYRKIFWMWYGLQSLTPAEARQATPFTDPVTKQPKKPKLYHPDADIRGVDHLIQYEMYEDVYGKFPVVQIAPEPGPGYFVSQLPPPRVNPQYPEWDQRCTLVPNATEVQAYASLSTPLAYEAKVNKRDMVLAIRLDSGKSLAFPFIDVGNKPAVAECSATAFVKLDGVVRPRPGKTPLFENNFQLLYLAFPNSAGQAPSATLSKFATASNAEEFSTVLAFIAKATADAWHDPRGATRTRERYR